MPQGSFWKRLLEPQIVTDRPHYFVWVDFLRGVAAISVLLWHYQHFYYTDVGVSTLTDRSVQPFFTELQLFYTYGAAAVQLFWVTSGFVFANIYTTRAEDTKASDFATSRLARLYPLHFVTLLVVALLQLVSAFAVGHHQIYPYNDAYHFLLNLGFASYWGLQRGFSFNAPIWSVSVEILIYVVFFISMRRSSRQPTLAPLAMAGLFALLWGSKIGSSSLWQCGVFFFLGCVTFKLWHSLDASGARHAVLAGVGGIIVAAPMRSLAFTLHRFLPGEITPDEITKIIAFPSIVLLAASLDRLDVARLGSRLGFVGNLTYSTYLWHVPVQISMLIVLEAFAFDRGVVSSPEFFALFFVTVLGVSHFSFKYIEMPARLAVHGYFSRTRFGRSLLSDARRRSVRRIPFS
jgi:peptidoglycan/LPS O-acetylase OafA/YrhL